MTAEGTTKRSRQDEASAPQQAASAGASSKRAKIDAVWQQLKSSSSQKQQLHKPASSTVGPDSISLSEKLQLDPRASSLGGLSTIIAGLQRKQAPASEQRAAALPRQTGSKVAAALSGVKAAQASGSSGDTTAALLQAAKAVRAATAPPAAAAPGAPALAKAPGALSGAAAAAAPAGDAPVAKPALAGLDAALAGLQQKKTTVLTNTRKDWQQFKQADVSIHEELETYKKSNDKYLDKVDFLKRAELREYDIERDERASRRPNRSDAPTQSP